MAKIPSQRERLIAFFDSGKTLTRLTAWSELGILEAPARISELRSSNYPIVTKMITVKNRYGESVRVAEWKKQEYKHVSVGYHFNVVDGEVLLTKFIK
jgi:hypothetical protein